MNVVIVDDTQINVTLMQALVNRIDGCKPVCFTDSAAGLAWCLTNQPDLVIVDYMMPAPDGIEFIQRLRAEPDKAELPILMVTADHEKEVRYRALETGANDFLTKPVDRIEFTSRVKNMLAIRRSHLALTDRAAWLAEEVGKATAEIREREREAVFRLARAAEFRDPETGAHIQRMAHYSKLIAAQLGLDRAQQDLILEAAPMHDVGKLGTPDMILLKPGKLTPEEFAVMKQHATIGWEILKGSAAPTLQVAAEIAHTHHEKYDGSGYPRGLAGEQIPLFGRIVAIADVFDALTSARPYKAAWELDRAWAFIAEGRGTHFDPVCTDAFLAVQKAVIAVRDQFRDPDEE
ncbi:MAG: response regulator [Rhodocyclaceae bacterium]|nr:response regulator [Rhodocyclaceae bacterium]MDZ4216201.1 response regulator [Rhodocyclaceae bacterium]